MDSKRKHTFALILIALLALTAGVIAAQYLIPRPVAVDDAQAGVRVPAGPGKFGGDFTLHNGDRTVTLSEFKDRVVVMYFGYASCPDVCPTTLGLIGAALKRLTPEESAQVQPIFISVDPERDTPERLNAYAPYFYPTFIGVTGSLDEVKKVAGQYGAFFAKTQTESAMGYLVDHTSKTYVISRDHDFVRILPHDMTVPELVDAIRAELKE